MKDLIVEKFNLLPTSFEQAERYAVMISKSSFAPEQFKDKPHDVLIAIQMGNELGLPPLQALQNITVINGRPSLWGDAMLAVVKNHPKFEYIKEELIDNKAICKIKRKGEEEHVVTFSLEDAKRASLLNKPGPWSQYPKRMLQMRARGFACRDAFPDALKGLISREEAEDYPDQQLIDAAKSVCKNIDAKFDALSNESREKLINHIGTLEVDKNKDTNLVELTLTEPDQIIAVASNKYTGE
jgi:hypothetical protein